MPLAYLKPGVTVDEVVSPSFATSAGAPTTVAIIGPTRGFVSHTEVFLLSDNAPHTFAFANVDTSTIVVTDYNDATAAPFLEDTTSTKLDYVIDTSLVATTGLSSIHRSMQTTIVNHETVVAYYENPNVSPAQGTSFTDAIELDDITATGLPHADVHNNVGSIVIESQGKLPDADFTITGAGTGSVNVKLVNSPSVAKRFQTVYVTYDIGIVHYTDLVLQLNNTTNVALPANSINHVFYNASGLTGTNAVTIFTVGSTTDNDYIVVGSGASTAVHRSAGTTTIGSPGDQLVVKVTYNATPNNYFDPTQMFSQADIESKYGTALDASGNVNSPLAFAAALAFQNGAANVVCQALFAVDNGGNKIAPTGATADWQSSVAQLRNVDFVNVIVPLISTGGLLSNDSLNLSVFQAIRSHIQYMNGQNDYIVGIFGEDSTSPTQAAAATLRNHAQSLGSTNEAPQLVLLSPASYAFQNPVTNAQSAVGGQYVAAAFAGMLAGQPISQTLTRKLVSGFSQVLDTRTETDKNTDAQAGLVVVENYRGNVRVRHAITTSQSSVATRELSVVRAKFFMIETVQNALETQIIGRIVADSRAATTIQSVVSTTLQQMVDANVIASYAAVQVRASTNDPTQFQVQFSYLPDFPLNYINVQFSLDTTTGQLTTTTGV